MILISEKRFTIAVLILIHGKGSLQQTNLYRGERDSFDVIKLKLLKDSEEYYLYYGSLKDSVSIINIKQNKRFISCKKLNIAKRIN